MAEIFEKGEEAIELIEKFYLTELDHEWVKGVINSDFTEATEIPVQFEEVHVSTNFFGLFNAVINTLRQYVDLIKTDSNTTQTKRQSLTFLSTQSLSEQDYEMSDMFTKFWISMTKNVTIKSLLAFLFYYIHKGQRYDSNEENRELGIHSSSMYFLLLSIPGSNAFRVFHPILYLKALDVLKLTTKLNVGAVSPKKGGRGSRLSHRKSSEDHIGDGNEDEDAELSYLGPAEASKLIRSLNVLLNDFLGLSGKFSLKHSAESLDETISVLVEITRCEIHNAQAVFLQRHAANSVAALAYNAYVALQNLCDPLHGNPKKIVIIIMKYLIFNILMISRGTSDLSTRALTVIKEHSVIFVKYLMIQLKEVTLEGAYILVQHICLRVPDKADFREKTAKAVVEILKVFPLKEYSQMINWLCKFSKHEKAGHRLFTLEVISKLLTEDERQTDAEETNVNSQGELEAHNSEDQEDAVNTSAISATADDDVSVPINKQVLSHKFLLCIIFSRCQDSAATVRSKALFLLSECTLSGNPKIIEVMKQIFLNKDPLILKPSEMAENEANEESFISEDEDEFHLPNAEVVMNMLQRRALDDKVMVRKSALQVMENLMKLKAEMVTINYLKALADHCRDPALLIRKQMIQSLSSIVETYPGNNAAIKTWVSGVLPLILDPEIKVQEKVIELVNNLIFCKIRRFNNFVSSVEEMLPWNILDTITKLSYHKFFNKVLMLWAKGDQHSRIQVISIARTHIGKKYNEQTWTFLALVLQYININDPSFIVDYFEENWSSNEIGSYTLQQVLKSLCYVIKYIPAEKALKIQEELLSVITSLSVSVELISPMIDIVTNISYNTEKDEENSQKAVESWSSSILKSCDEYIKKALFPAVPYNLDKEEEERFFRYLFTLGEVSQLCPAKVNKRLFLMMQSIIFHQNHSLKENVRMPSTQTQSSQPLALSFNPTRRLKTLAVITLGKMCLQHEDQAKRIIPAMGKMLETTTLASMKINIIIVLSDMCVRYATLVDPLMPQVTACLRDSDIQVRKTTLTLLINLLQEDYLKLKGSFFYRILQCLCDEDEEIRSTVIFYMTERLLKRFPKIFLQHIIECIFHYNCYEEHESYNRFIQSRQEKELFSLAGEDFRDQRMMLYRFMLDHMADDQRFATTQRLCQDVLGAVVDGRIKLTPSCLPMLEDTFMVLSSDEIKLAWLKSRPEDSDQPTDLSEQAEMAGIVIKKNIISQVVKRNVIENIVPILIALKHKLAEHRSPLMKQLLLYFKEIMKDYKNEVKEILAGDKQLAKEIEFDLRKLEEQDRRDSELIQQEKTRKSLASKEARRLTSQLSEDLDLSVNTDEVPETSESVSKDGSNTSKMPESGETEESDNAEETPDNREKENQNLKCDSGDQNRNENVESSVPPSVPSSPIFRRKSNVSVLLKKALINSQKKSIRKQIQASIRKNIDKEDACASETNEPDEENACASEANELDMEDACSSETNEPDKEEACPSETNEPDKQDACPSETNEPDKQDACPSETNAPIEERLAPSQEMEEREIITKKISNKKRRSKDPKEQPETETVEKVISTHNRKLRKKLMVNVPVICTPEKQRADGPSLEVKENLMRAISTPNPSQKVIRDITFVNRTQDISSISLTDSELTRDQSKKSKSTDNSSTLLLHFRSPEAFAKEDEFSRLRRASKKCLNINFKKSSPKKAESPKQATKRSSGGFMESFNVSESLEEDDSSFISESVLTKRKRKSSKCREK